MDHRVKTAHGPTILLASGNYFDLLDPASSHFTLGDIAHGLANTCRFAGQCREFYSVAEHTWHASFLVPENLKLGALMHDAAEAFIGDVTRPLKQLLPNYRKLEKEIERVIAERFGLGDACNHEQVKKIDVAMLAAEQAVMMPPHADNWAVLNGVEAAQFRFRGWTPKEAKSAWLNRFSDLVGIFPVDHLQRAQGWQ